MFNLLSRRLLAQTNTPVPAPSQVTIPAINPGITIPDFNTVLTFLVRSLFIVAGLMALLYLLLGAIAWITSGGNKENVDKAREKIQAAVIGLILVVVVLTLIMLIESLTGLGLGISKPIVFFKLSSTTL